MSMVQNKNHRSKKLIRVIPNEAGFRPHIVVSENLMGEKQESNHSLQISRNTIAAVMPASHDQLGNLTHPSNAEAIPTKRNEDINMRTIFISKLSLSLLSGFFIGSV